MPTRADGPSSETRQAPSWAVLRPTANTTRWVRASNRRLAHPPEQFRRNLQPTSDMRPPDEDISCRPPKLVADLTCSLKTEYGDVGRDRNRCWAIAQRAL